MTAARPPSDERLPSHSRDREDVYYTHPRPLPRIWLSEDYGSSTGPKRQAFENGDTVTSGNICVRKSSSETFTKLKQGLKHMWR